jgi:methylmalonyl-CoA mutase C-terminal domain/subunit
MEKKIRVLVAKPGLDGHDRGAKVVASAMRDAGFEVIYAGLRQTPEMIVETAIQEDVDVIALSILSGAHMTIFPRVLQLMRENNIADKLLTGGGIIPGKDMQTLMEMGTGRLPISGIGLRRKKKHNQSKKNADKSMAGK